MWYTNNVRRLSAAKSVEQAGNIDGAETDYVIERYLHCTTGGVQCSPAHGDFRKINRGLLSLNVDTNGPCFGAVGKPEATHGGSRQYFFMKQAMLYAVLIFIENHECILAVNSVGEQTILFHLFLI